MEGGLGNGESWDPQTALKRGDSRQRLTATSQVTQPSSETLTHPRMARPPETHLQHKDRLQNSHNPGHKNPECPQPHSTVGQQIPAHTPTERYPPGQSQAHSTHGNARIPPPAPRKVWPSQVLMWVPWTSCRSVPLPVWRSCWAPDQLTSTIFPIS